MADKEKTVLDFSLAKANGFIFTDDEQLQAYIFSPLQLKNLQTELANWAMRRALLRYDPTLENGEKAFIMESEYLRGGIEMIGYLIAQHESAEETVGELLKESLSKAQEEERRVRNQHPDTDDGSL